MTCQRCQGFLSVGYDEVERCRFVRCLNCGRVLPRIAVGGDS